MIEAAISDSGRDGGALVAVAVAGLFSRPAIVEERNRKHYRIF